MASLTMIDADSHVEEPLEVWDYLDAEFAERKPVAVTAEERDSMGKMNAYWLVDGNISPTPHGPGACMFGTPTTMSLAQMKPWSIGSQELSDPEARVRDLDAWGIDVQVLYPTVFLRPLTEDPRFEAALMRSYNTWISTACKANERRLKWVGLVPMLNVPEAVKEVGRIKELGGVGITLFGTVGDTLIHEPQFDPVWAEASRLDLTVNLHAGWSMPSLNRMCDHIFAAQILSFSLPLLCSFYSLVGGGLLDRFPSVRWGIHEAGSEWVLYLAGRMNHYYKTYKGLKWEPLPEKSVTEYLREGNLFFSCEASEALLPQVVEMVGEDCLFTSADMPHSEARDNDMSIIAERTDLGESVKRKILSENAARFYKL